MYVKMFKMTKDKITGKSTVIEHFSRLGDKITYLQRSYGHIKPVGFALRGFFEGDHGHEIVYSNVFSIAGDVAPIMPPGNLFFHSRSDYVDYMKNHSEFRSNHVGFIVWDHSGLFIFDPSSGGQLVDADNFSQEGIERCLNMMYIRQNKLRRAKILLIIKPNFSAEKNACIFGALK
ncbi:hypothetical protein Xmau_02748 [Xenorhabdus mauleonii]|uniref:Uncharacterized protein n=2 Tax=Xenorhabdus mauleonii TaxID=351675 RepID=A0A1I3I9E0_9GAMM|nr:hypothetical protein Xmau_02748 [Xenorhabdus mauleonii]SFI44614.1 hypothetical protein SAMN05421680_101246 [Xenorhabdus mauleonii]